MTTRPSVDRVWASQAASSNIQDPDTFVPNKVTTGWEAEIPPFQWFNWIQNRNDLFKLALAERGVAEWGTDVTYSSHSLAYYGDHIWIAVKENKGVTPVEGDTWHVSSAEITQNNLDDLKARIEQHITRTNNPHSVTAAQVGAYSKGEADNLLNIQEGDLTDHETDFSNPHKVTAEQAGGVPTTGGTYTGTVDIQSDTFTIAKGKTAKPYGLVRSGNDVFLSTTDDKLGIKGGKPVFVDGATDNELLYAGNFKALKDKYEPLYRVPTPDFYMPLTCDINIYEGDGIATFSRASTATYINKAGVTVTAGVDEPRFPKGGIQLNKASSFRGDNLDEPSLYAVSDDKLSIENSIYSPVNSDCTFSFDFDLDAITSAYQVPVSFEVSSGTPLRLALKTGGWELWCEGLSAYKLGTSSLSGMFTISRSGNNLSIYLNGKLIKGATASGKTSVPQVGRMVQIGADTTSWSNHINGKIKNFCVWGEVLTPEQISTL